MLSLKKKEMLMTEYFENRRDFSHLKPVSVAYRLGTRKFRVVSRTVQSLKNTEHEFH
jgi:hypothetical protein